MGQIKEWKEGVLYAQTKECVENLDFFVVIVRLGIIIVIYILLFYYRGFFMDGPIE